MSKIPLMLVRMRCPECRAEARFGVEYNLPLEHLPEVTKNVMRCNCKNHIPKINKNTPVEKSLMSINAVPLKKLLSQKQAEKNGNGKSSGLFRYE